MRYFTLTSFAFIAILATVGCLPPTASEVPPRIPATTGAAAPPSNTGADTGVGCRSSDPVPVGEGIEPVLQGVARAQTNDLRCGPPAERVRVCRALFVLATIDPAAQLTRPDMLRRATDAVEWAVADAAEVAPPELTDAFGSVQRSMDMLIAATDDDKRLGALVARSSPATVEALDAYWVQHCA